MSRHRAVGTLRLTSRSHPFGPRTQAQGVPGEKRFSFFLFLLFKKTRKIGESVVSDVVQGMYDLRPFG